jgi:hypothetical protein
MTTKLDRPMKREVQIGEKAYTLTIDADGLKLVEKGRRNGISVNWKSLVGAEDAGATPGGEG